MGCVHSAPDRVEAATTSDELTRPTRGGPAQQDQAQDTFRRADNNNNNNLQPQNVIPVQPHAEAPSSGSLGARPPRSSSRIAAQQDGASDSLQPSLTADGAPRPLPEPPRALVSVGVPRPPRALPTASKKTVGRTAQLPPIRRLAPQPTAASATQTSPSGLPAPSGNPVDAPPPLPPPPPLQPQQPPAGEATPAQIVSALPALKDLLARISAPQPQPPQQQPVDRKLVLIVWDIENVRCPNGKDPLLTPAKVLGYIKAHFIHEVGRTEYRTVAAVTPKSLGVIRKLHPDFVDQMVPELTLLVASADEPKRNADVMLKKELYRFVSEHSHIARHSPGQLSVVLISGDEDFLEPVQVALNSGFSVELMHHDNPSWALRTQQGYVREPLLWSDFLKQRSGAEQVKLPYARR